MIRIGEIKKGSGPWEKISFKEWLSKGLASAGKFSVKVMFPPSKYPTFTLIFEDPIHTVEVRTNIKAEKIREVFNALGLPFRKTDLPTLVFEVEVEENGGLIYGLDIDQDSFYLCWKGTYWIRKRKEEPQDLDIEL